jgi:hypothetical protein
MEWDCLNRDPPGQRTSKATRMESGWWARRAKDPGRLGSSHVRSDPGVSEGSRLKSFLPWEGKEGGDLGV